MLYYYRVVRSWPPYKFWRFDVLSGNNSWVETKAYKQNSSYWWEIRLMHRANIIKTLSSKALCLFTFAAVPITPYRTQTSWFILLLHCFSCDGLKYIPGYSPVAISNFGDTGELQRSNLSATEVDTLTGPLKGRNDGQFRCEEANMPDEGKGLYECFGKQAYTDLYLG